MWHVIKEKKKRESVVRFKGGGKRTKTQYREWHTAATAQRGSYEKQYLLS